MPPIAIVSAFLNGGLAAIVRLALWAAGAWWDAIMLGLLGASIAAAWLARRARRTRTLGGVLIALGAVQLGFVGFVVWAHHMYTVGMPSPVVWIAVAYVLVCVAPVAIGLRILRELRTLN